MSESKQDRELIELLNELRVALPGVQVMFAFLLAVPFSQGWTKVTDTQKTSFLVALLTTAIASALLIAPSSFHRIQWRQGDKERLLVISNGFAIAGLAFLAISMCAVVFTITDYVVGGQFAIWTTASVGLLFGLLWYAIPLYRRAQTDD
jgi:membrane protein YdbS with pleckstrin-like domain